MDYEWEGNVRELKHMIEYACITCPGSHIKLEHLPDYILTANHAEDIPVMRLKIDKALLVNVLDKHKWHKIEAAKALGIHRSTLYRLIDKFEMHKDHQKQDKKTVPHTG